MRQKHRGVFLAASAAAVFLLGACGAIFDEQDWRELETSGTGFNDILSREYKTFALFEADKMDDWPDAYRFGTKAIHAAKGGATGPERLDDWDLPEGKVGELAAARNRLLRVMAGGVSAHTPRDAAIAQARFDCWVEQQEEDFQPTHIARCRDGFYAALVNLEETVKDPRSFVFLFDFNNASIGPDDAAKIDTVAKIARAGEEVRVTIGGHADRAGPATYNMGLSRERAVAISSALVARGVDSKRITLSAFGESRPRVRTADGVREPINRRVELTVGPAPAL